MYRLDGAGSKSHIPNQRLADLWAMPGNLDGGRDVVLGGGGDISESIVHVQSGMRFRRKRWRLATSWRMSFEPTGRNGSKTSRKSWPRRLCHYTSCGRRSSIRESWNTSDATSKDQRR